MKKIVVICSKNTELEQFSSGPAAFSDIRDLSKIAVFKILAVFLTRAQFWGLGPNSFFLVS